MVQRCSFGVIRHVDNCGIFVSQSNYDFRVARVYSIVKSSSSTIVLIKDFGSCFDKGVHDLGLSVLTSIMKRSFKKLISCIYISLLVQEELYQGLESKFGSDMER
jgi:hypothetical protein